MAFEVILRRIVDEELLEELEGTYETRKQAVEKAQDLNAGLRASQLSGRWYGVRDRGDP